MKRRAEKWRGSRKKRGGFVCLGLYAYESNLRGNGKCLSNINTYLILISSAS